MVLLKPGGHGGRANEDGKQIGLDGEVKCSVSIAFFQVKRRRPESLYFVHKTNFKDILSQREEEGHQTNGEFDDAEVTQQLEKLLCFGFFFFKR